MKVLIKFQDCRPRMFTMTCHKSLLTLLKVEEYHIQIQRKSPRPNENPKISWRHYGITITIIWAGDEKDVSRRLVQIRDSSTDD